MFFHRADSDHYYWYHKVRFAIRTWVHLYLFINKCVIYFPLCFGRCELQLMRLGPWKHGLVTAIRGIQFNSKSTFPWIDLKRSNRFALVLTRVVERYLLLKKERLSPCGHYLERPKHCITYASCIDVARTSFVQVFFSLYSSICEWFERALLTAGCWHRASSSLLFFLFVMHGTLHTVAFV